jgi:hypothetical protein
MIYVTDLVKTTKYVPLWSKITTKTTKNTIFKVIYAYILKEYSKICGPILFVCIDFLL